MRRLSALSCCKFGWVLIGCRCSIHLTAFVRHYVWSYANAVDIKAVVRTASSTWVRRIFSKRYIYRYLSDCGSCCGRPCNLVHFHYMTIFIYTQSQQSRPEHNQVTKPTLTDPNKLWPLYKSLWWKNVRSDCPSKLSLCRLNSWQQHKHPALETLPAAVWGGLFSVGDWTRLTRKQVVTQRDPDSLTRSGLEAWWKAEQGGVSVEMMSSVRADYRSLRGRKGRKGKEKWIAGVRWWDFKLLYWN